MSHDRGCPCGRERWEYENCPKKDCYKSHLVAAWREEDNKKESQPTAKPTAGYIYLASPYTILLPNGKFDEPAMEVRYYKVLHCCAKLIKAGYIVYCPIAITHEVDKILHRKPAEFWYEFDETFVSRADALYVFKLPGWMQSQGIAREVRLARSLGIPIISINPNISENLIIEKFG